MEGFESRQVRIQNIGEVGGRRTLLPTTDFHTPVCILRVPGLDDDSTERSRQPVSSIFMPPVYEAPKKKQNEQYKKYTPSGIPGGSLNDKLLLHVLKDDLNQNLHTHRLSYDSKTDKYYENGNIEEEFITGWKNGVLQWNNVERKIEYDWNMVYLARDPRNYISVPGEIKWKFDYRTSNLIIKKFILKLQHALFDNEASIILTITTLPTRKNKNPTPQTIEFPKPTKFPHEENNRKDVTSFVENEYGFILTACLKGGENNNISWQRTQLFRKSLQQEFLDNNIDDDSGINFGLDTRTELMPDVICDPLPEIKYDDDDNGKGIERKDNNEFILNDEKTSDFVINLREESPQGSTNEIKIFNTHSKILSTRSEYFKALLHSKMIESNERSLTIVDTKSDLFEIILKFIYTGDLPIINKLDDWFELLRGASRFLILELIQRCEKEIRGFLNPDNVEEIESIAIETGSSQLLRCCENLEIKE
ncbi:1252_t:CDS:2 [Diversispora eburnea]|uniref:1252_t:CDS:1 n=1 Tax=Diversispora eburnea TaxID=1213867 RepID=A0A9N9A8L0_9GLOM|nr:1252_t:CDS:2 [Diversispora eburnea]